MNQNDQARERRSQVIDDQDWEQLKNRWPGLDGTRDGARAALGLAVAFARKYLDRKAPPTGARIVNAIKKARTTLKTLRTELGWFSRERVDPMVDSMFVDAEGRRLHPGAVMMPHAHLELTGELDSALSEHDYDIPDNELNRFLKIDVVDFPGGAFYDQQHRIDSFSTSLEELDRLLAEEERRLGPSIRKTGNPLLHVLVRYLDDVVSKFSGNRFYRSKRSERFVEEVCKIINREVPKTRKIKYNEIGAAVRAIHDEREFLLMLYERLYGHAFRYDYDAEYYVGDPESGF
jgi:hypothetical protein